MHLKHSWTPWEYDNHDHEYTLDGSFWKMRYEHVSYCLTCNKPRVRKFKTIAPPIKG
jgi:hypothetical protein